jgi:hypothetical protein
MLRCARSTGMRMCTRNVSRGCAGARLAQEQSTGRYTYVSVLGSLPAGACYVQTPGASYLSSFINVLPTAWPMWTYMVFRFILLIQAQLQLTIFYFLQLKLHIQYIAVVST